MGEGPDSNFKTYSSAADFLKETARGGRKIVYFSREGCKSCAQMEEGGVVSEVAKAAAYYGIPTIHYHVTADSPEKITAFMNKMGMQKTPSFALVEKDKLTSSPFLGEGNANAIVAQLGLKPLGMSPAAQVEPPRKGESALGDFKKDERLMVSVPEKNGFLKLRAPPSGNQMGDQLTDAEGEGITISNGKSVTVLNPKPESTGKTNWLNVKTARGQEGWIAINGPRGEAMLTRSSRSPDTTPRASVLAPPPG